MSGEIVINDEIEELWLNVYMITDDLAHVCFFPFLSENEETAKRSFRSVVMTTKFDCSDYRLDYIGQFCKQTGAFDLVNEKKTIMFGREVYKDVKD